MNFDPATPDSAGNGTDRKALAGKSHPKQLGFRVLMVLLSCLISTALAELGLRSFFRQRFFIYQDEKSLLYRYDRILGWFPIANAREQFLASRIFNVVNNSEGFRAPEHVPNDKLGIVFL